MSKFFSNVTISLKTALISLIVVVIMFLVINILFFAYQGNKYATFKITEKLMYQIFSTTAQKLNFYFESSGMSLRDLDFTLKGKQFDFDNKPEEFLNYLERILIVNPSITGAYVGNERGDFYMAKRMSDGSISYRLIKRKKNSVDIKWIHANSGYEQSFPSGSFSLSEGYDPRVRPWYIAAQEENRTIWTDPYIFASDRLLGVSVASPVNLGNMEGVFAVDFGLAEINDFIKNIPISRVGSLFLFDRDDKLIAYSSPYKHIEWMYKEVPQQDGSKSVELLSISDIQDPLLDGLYSHYSTESSEAKDGVLLSSLYKNEFFVSILNIYIGLFVNQESLMSGSQTFFESDDAELNAQDYSNQAYYSSYEFGDEVYLFMLNNFNVSDSFTTKLGIVIPQAVVVSYFYYTYQIILFTTIGFVIISLFIIIFIANRGISSPIMILSKRISGMVNDFQLDPIKDEYTGLTEIRHISSSIENVRQALVSFKKYLPKEVVADLVKSGKEATIGGEKKEVTIFFSDIRGFTKISEENPSDILFQKLGKYFSLVDRYITKNDGILDKFIGDAVMALWGVPNPIPNHAASACLSAIEIKEHLANFNKQLRDEDFPTFYTRIGIHSGMALVGNIGSENRMNYTCIGDEVNLASRLEGLNKFYRTQILVSNITLQHAKELVEHRIVDRVVVKGKTQEILIHEVIAKRGELYGDDREFLKNYKEGMRFYFEGYWENAEASLKAALQKRPDDYITQQYLEKVKSFASKKINKINPEEMCLERRGRQTIK